MMTAHFYKPERSFIDSRQNPAAYFSETLNRAYFEASTRECVLDCRVQLYQQPPEPAVLSRSRGYAFGRNEFIRTFFVAIVSL